MPGPLTITSTTNAFALVAYASLATLGGIFTFTESPAALLALVSEDVCTALMGVLMFGGLAGFSACFVSAAKRDPSMGLAVEIGTLIALTLTLSVFLVSLIQFYGSEAPTAITFAASYFAGSICRLAQASRECRKLNRARRQRRRRTVEVIAEPDRE